MKYLLASLIYYGLLWFTGFLQIFWNGMIASWTLGNAWHPAYAISILYGFLLLLPVLHWFSVSARR
jgi:hypothetical protein